MAIAGLNCPAGVLGAMPHNPSELPGVLIHNSISAPPPTCAVTPSLRPAGLHHSPLPPLPLRLVSTTNSAA